MKTSSAFSATAALSYGLFGLPLAMVALPIYIFIPQFYAEHSGLALATIGTALLFTRLLAALTDPLLGWWVQGSNGSYSRFLLLSIPLLLIGFAMLFHLPPLGNGAALAWFVVSLLTVYLGFGLAMIAHQSWGAALSQKPGERTRIAAYREACGLVGVITAAGLSGWLGYDLLLIVFAICLLLSGALLILKAPRPLLAAAARPNSSRTRTALLAPFEDKLFRALFKILMVNGLAAAIPATLFLFFAKDKLKLAPYSGGFLILYFMAAAASMPLWVKLARRWGEARTWVIGMLSSALVFVWAYALEPGAVLGFGSVCLLSGMMLGADLALPPALLAGVIARAGHSGGREAAYFGWWNWGVQMTLALAAGITLPLLEWQGYLPGQTAGLNALSATYALLPCCLKLIAASMLWRAPLRDC